MQKKKKNTIAKINKAKSWLFGKINKSTNYQPDSKKQREKNQITKLEIGSENGEITTDNIKMHRIIRDYYQQLYGNVFYFIWKA